MKLYIAYWNPNGTNDLLVCDDDHQIIECIEEATFGINVTRGISDLETVLVADDQCVFGIKLGETEHGETECGYATTELPSELTVVSEITVDDLLKRLCVSPVDPDGSHVMARLRKAGVPMGDDHV